MGREVGRLSFSQKKPGLIPWAVSTGLWRKALTLVQCSRLCYTILKQTKESFFFAQSTNFQSHSQNKARDTQGQRGMARICKKLTNER